MPLYKLEVLGPPDESDKFHRKIFAADDMEAIRQADEFVDSFASEPNVKLDRYVLYDDGRVVRERILRKR